MRLQKTISVWAGIVAGISLGISISLYLLNFEYISNIFVGLFSSGILVCITSVVSYFHERNKVIFALYEGCLSFMETLNGGLRIDNRMGIYELRDNLSQIMASYKKDIYYYVCELMRVNKYSDLHQIVAELWEAARHIYLFVVDDNEQVMKCLLGDITPDEIKNYPWKYVSSKSVTYLKDLQKARDKLAYHMNYYNVRKGKKGTEVGEDCHAD